LVNTARGAIVETQAVVDALKSGILAGFASDVLEQEKEIKSEADYLAKEFLNKEELEVMLYDHILMKMPNVLITPHNAFNSIEALQRILNTTIDNINGFLSNRPVNLVS
jgi:D-lactate dehydrogenase